MRRHHTLASMDLPILLPLALSSQMMSLYSFMPCINRSGNSLPPLPTDFICIMHGGYFFNLLYLIDLNVGLLELSDFLSVFFELETNWQLFR